MAVITAERQAAIAKELQSVVAQIDYSNYDFYSIKSALLQYLKIQYPETFNDYFEDSVMMAFIESVAYLGEQLAYRQDININEVLPTSVSIRDNVLNLYKLVGYSSSRASSGVGTVKLVIEYEVDGVTPLTDANNIGGVSRWLFNPEITYATTGDLTVNGVYTTILPNHIPITVSIGAETFSYELASTSYSSDLAAISVDALETNTLSVVWDGVNFVCALQQGLTITETFEQGLSQADLVYNTSKTGVDQTTPYVSVNTVKWEHIPNIYVHTSPTNHLFTTSHDGEDRLEVEFGDGISAAIPRGTISIMYRITDGIKGNIPASYIDVSVRKTVENPSTGFINELVNINVIGKSPVTGGVDKESTATIKKHGPALYAAQNRQVTGPDYEAAILDVKGIKKAKVINRTYTGHDATGLYSSAAFVGQDAVSGGVATFDTPTNFDGVNLGIDTITVVDVADIDNLHPVTSFSETAGVWTVNTVTGMPASWSGNYLWKHWAANTSGSVKFIPGTYSAGAVSVPLMILDHIPAGSKVTIHDSVNQNTYYADPAIDITYLTGPTNAVIAFRDGDGVLQSAVTLSAAVVFVDYTLNADGVVPLTVPVSPAPTKDYIYYTTGVIKTGDNLWEVVSADGYIVLDVVIEEQTGFDKIYITRNTRTNANGTLVASAQFNHTTYNRATSVIQNPSRSNIIDAYILLDGTDGLPLVNLTDSTVLTAVEEEITDTKMINDIAFTHWGNIKYMQIPLTVYLKQTGLSSSELRQRIQQAVTQYFRLEKPTDWKYQDLNFGDTFRTSPMINYLHDLFPQIDYIDHLAFDPVDKTAQEHEIVSVDVSFQGVTIG